MTKRSLILLLLTLPVFVQAQKIESFWNVMPELYNFDIYEPSNYDPVNSVDMPVVMFLHGRSMSEGLNGERYGSITAIQQGYDIFLGQPALILEPNSKSGQGWTSSKIHQVYEFLKAHYAFDHDRFYVIGMSMGGWGTLNYVNAYPNEVAACVAIGGGCDAKSPCNLNKVPTWIIHAADDDVTSVTNSDKVVAAMKACGSTNLLKYSRLDSGGHSLINYFRYSNMYEWLFAHTIKNRKFNTSIDFVTKPEVNSNAMFWYGSGVIKKVEITSAELSKIKARTPKTKQNGGSQTVATNTTSTKPTTGTNNQTTAKPTTTTNKPSTTTSKPASTTTSKPAKNVVKTYTVKQGDTLKNIAKKCKTSVRRLRRWNNFSKKHMIRPGDKIRYK